jgi:hypothetical protein
MGQAAARLRSRPRPGPGHPLRQRDRVPEPGGQRHPGLSQPARHRRPTAGQSRLGEQPGQAAPSSPACASTAASCRSSTCSRPKAPWPPTPQRRCSWKKTVPWPKTCSACWSASPACKVAAGDLRSLPVPPTPPAGLPSSLLEARPDVRKAETDLIAANAKIGVAKAALFPSITLTGSLGRESKDLSQLFTPRRRGLVAGRRPHPAHLRRRPPARPGGSGQRPAEAEPRELSQVGADRLPRSERRPRQRAPERRQPKTPTASAMQAAKRACSSPRPATTAATRPTWKCSRPSAPPTTPPSPGCRTARPGCLRRWICSRPSEAAGRTATPPRRRPADGVPLDVPQGWPPEWPHALHVLPPPGPPSSRPARLARGRPSGAGIGLIG